MKQHPNKPNGLSDQDILEADVTDVQERLTHHGAIRAKNPTITLLPSHQKHGHTQEVDTDHLLDLCAKTNLVYTIDVVLLTVVTTIISLTWGGHEMVVYPVTMGFFLFMAWATKLYNLQTSHYMAAKSTTLAGGILIPQILLFYVAGMPTLTLMTCAALTLGFIVCQGILHHMASRPFTKADPTSIYHRMETWMKRLFDIGFTSVGALIISPTLIATAVLVWLEGEGNIIYKQPRMGQHEKTFTMYKFRSMADAKKPPEDPGLETSKAGKLFKMKNDPRITKLGSLLRRSSMDEMPQLFNVLRGDMSLVGPRPPLIHEYEQMADHHRVKFHAVPGITGLWQITGRIKEERDFDSVAVYDTTYIDQWCFLQDLWILFKTIPVVVLQKGAF